MTSYPAPSDNPLIESARAQIFLDTRTIDHLNDALGPRQGGCQDRRDVLRRIADAAARLASRALDTVEAMNQAEHTSTPPPLAIVGPGGDYTHTIPATPTQEPTR